MNVAKDWYNASYTTLGANAQRNYPNEELCRFMGRNFFPLSQEKRKEIKILEVGCGSGGNLWMLAREGFDVYGCDLSEVAIEICATILKNKWDTQAELVACNMLELPFENDYMDVVIDVGSSTCMCRTDYLQFLDETYRVLKQGGRFFSYFPSKRSDTFLRSSAENRMDEDTLPEIVDKKSPYFGQEYPFRFMSEEDVSTLLPAHGFKLEYLERLGRTYDGTKEYFEWLVFEAEKLRV